MSRFIFLPFICMFLSNPEPQSPSCSCGYNGAFLTVATGSAFVAYVKVIKHLSFKDIYGEKTPMSMEVEIIEIYKGEEIRKTVIVWGDPGNLCRPYLSYFKEGAYYLIAFSPAGRGSNEKPTDYTISICGAYWLNVDAEKKTASGDIDIGKYGAVQTMDMSELKSEFLKN
jgi:hypothetical protein